MGGCSRVAVAAITRTSPRNTMAGEALRPISGPPDQLQRQMDQDMRQWRGIIKEKGVTLD